MDRLLRRSLAAIAAFAALATFAPASADAHFTLEAPASWMSQDSFGSPQKLGPCGDEAGGTPTGAVTAFAEGDTITVTIDEKIFHPGHYRIALGMNGLMDLPPEPVVTPGTNTPCGTAAIESPAMFPVLADDVFDHKTQLTAPQMIQ